MGKTSSELFKDSEDIILKCIFEKALTAGFTASDLAMLELSYMPKYNTATDIINVIGSKGEINNEFNEDTFNNNK